MNRSSYTASERRGVLAIAIAALLIIVFGLLFSWCSGKVDAQKESLEVVEYPEIVDSLSVKDKEKSKTKSKKKTKSSGKSKTKKTYRQRSPLDEPV